MPPADGGNVAAPAAGTTPYPRRWAKRKGHLRFPFLFELLPFPCFLIWRRLPTCDRFETGVRQRIFSSVSFETCSQSQIVFCYTDRLLPSSAAQGELPEEQERVPWGMTVPRNSLTRYTAWHLRIKRLVQFIFVGPVHHNALTNCAARLCRTLR